MFGRDYCWRFEHSARIAYCKQGRKLFASEHVRFGGHHPSMAPSVIVAWSTLLRSTNNLAVNAMHRGGKVLVSELRSTVADDDIAIGSVADRCLLSGVIQTFFWNVSNIDHRLREPEEHADSITVPDIGTYR